MADNYLENKFEQMQAGRKIVVRRNCLPLDTLLHRNRSVRGYDRSRKVTRKELESIIAVNTLVASARNRQTLRFRTVTSEEAGKVAPLLRMGAALPEENLPKPGQEPDAFIVICSTVPEDRYIDMDLGISLQSMGLRAAEMGLGCCIVCSFPADRLQAALGLELSPLAVLCIGKPVESIFLKLVEKDEPLDYYRKEGVHYVPKLRLEDIIIPEASQNRF